MTSINSNHGGMGPRDIPGQCGQENSGGRLQPVSKPKVTDEEAVCWASTRGELADISYCSEEPRSSRDPGLMRHWGAGCSGGSWGVEVVRGVGREAGRKPAGRYLGV